MISLLLTLALSQKAALTIEQATPVTVECVAAVPDATRDVATKEDPGTLYKVVTFQDEKDVAKLAESMGYNIVSCAAPVVTADKTSKVTVSAKPHACECAPPAAGCQWTPPAVDGKAGKSGPAPSDLTFPAGTLTGCTPVKTVCVELYGFPSLPNACRTKPITKEVAPKDIEVVK